MVFFTMRIGFIKVWTALLLTSLLVLSVRATQINFCPNVPGVTYFPCPDGPPRNVTGYMGVKPARIVHAEVGCDTTYAFGDTSPARYKLNTGTSSIAYITVYDLNIPAGQKIFLRTFTCPSGCVTVILDSNAVAPLTFKTGNDKFAIISTGVLVQPSLKFTVNPIRSCSEGWVNHCYFCYKYFDDTPMVWQKAQEHCRQQGGYLPTITGNPINVFIYTITKTDTWIGLTDLETEGTFKWANSSNSNYRSWASGHPRNSSVKDTDCVEKAKLPTPLNDFRDEYCWEQKNFVCEKYGADYGTIQVDFDNLYTFKEVKKQSYYIMETVYDAGWYEVISETLNIPENDTITLTYASGVSRYTYDNSTSEIELTISVKDFSFETASNSSAWLTFYISYIATNDPYCHGGWEKYHRDCYKFVFEMKTFEQAAFECYWLGSSLVSIESFRENEFVTSFLDTDVWIGMQESDTIDQWTPTNHFYAWHENQPDINGTYKDCGYIVKEVEGIAWTQSPHGLNWYGGNCNATRGYVCEMSISSGIRFHGEEISDCTPDITFRTYSLGFSWFSSFNYVEDQYSSTKPELNVIEVYEMSLPANTAVDVKPRDCQSVNCYFTTFYSGQSVPFRIPFDDPHFVFYGNKVGITLKFRLTVEKLCGPDWFQHATTCYKIIRTPETWDDAQTGCAAYGGELASTHCFLLNDKIATFLESDTWFGLEYNNNTDSYTWVDGSLIGWEYPNAYVSEESSDLRWYPGQPNVTSLTRACGVLKSDVPLGTGMKNFAMENCTAKTHEYLCQKAPEYSSDAFIDVDRCEDFVLGKFTSKFFHMNWDILRVVTMTNISMLSNVSVAIKHPNCYTADCEYLTINSTTAQPVKLVVPEEEFAIVASGGVVSMDVNIDTASVCNNAAMTRNCHECYIIPTSPSTFLQAKSTCAGVYQADLASIHNLENDTFASDFITADTWIGLENYPVSRNISAGYTVNNWTWADGTAVDYTSWTSVSTPDGIEEDCTYLVLKNPSVSWRNEAGKHWDDDDCTISKPFLCKNIADVDECNNGQASSCTAPGGTCINLESTWRCGCNAGYENPDGNDKTCIAIFRAFTYPLLKNAAATSCINKGGHLASIWDEAENNQVMAKIQAEVGSTYSSSVVFMIGLYQNLANRYTWSWGVRVHINLSTGEAIEENNYVNFADPAAYDEQGKDANDCIVMRNDNGKWEDVDCDTPRMYVCKMIAMEG